MTAMVAGRSRAEEGQGTVGPAICAAGVPTAEMACRVDLGTSVLEGSNVQENWSTDFGGMVGGGQQRGQGGRGCPWCHCPQQRGAAAPL
jgi:hypothetical protein